MLKNKVLVAHESTKSNGLCDSKNEVKYWTDAVCEAEYLQELFQLPALALRDCLYEGTGKIPGVSGFDD